MQQRIRRGFSSFSLFIFFTTNEKKFDKINFRRGYTKKNKHTQHTREKEPKLHKNACLM